MDKCVSCNSQLNIVKSGQTTEIGSTNIKTIVVKGCINKECTLYVGNDLNNPSNIQERSESTQDSVDI